MGEKENNNNQNGSPVARWLRNAVLGATMADQPAMMTASGWRQNEKGDYVQDQQNDPHVKQLRDNLAAEGIGVMGEMIGIPLIGSLLRKTPINTYTEDIIKLLGDRKSKGGFSGNRSTITKALSDYLQKQGIDVSQLSDRDLINLQSMRRESVINNLPKNKRLITAIEFKNPSTTTIEYSLREGDNIIGSLDNLVIKGNQHAGTIRSYNYSKHGISKDLYDGALKYGKQSNYKGLISGENLQSPEQTIHIWNKYYPWRKTIDKQGRHLYNHGENVQKTGGEYEVMGEVVDLIKPSGDIPVKSQNIFHPEMIDRNTWKLKAPDWNDKNVFKAIIPGISVYGITSTND